MAKPLKATYRKTYVSQFEALVQSEWTSFDAMISPRQGQVMLP